MGSILVGPFLFETMTTIEGKNNPSWREQRLINPCSIHLFITICDYHEEKYDDDEKETRPTFQSCLPSGHPA